MWATKADGYTPPAFWDQLQPIREALKINVIANGEIWTNADARACQQQSGCEDLMIGRGAVTTPDLTQCIRQNMDEALFSQQGVTVHYFDNSGYPEYTQQHGEFDHAVSIIDLLFNEGPNAKNFMKSFNTNPKPVQQSC